MSSRFPPTGLFDRVSSSEDLEIVQAIEGLTNDRLRDELGQIHLVPEDERVYGSGMSPIMAAFTHLNPEGSRFSDGSFGVYYAAKSINTAIGETLFHRARFLAATKQPPIEIDMRSYASNIDARLHDIRGQQKSLVEIYNPNPSRYAAAQDLAVNLRKSGSKGIIYDSVRDTGGECAAIFRPNILKPVVQGKHYCYVWNGQRMSAVYVKTEYSYSQVITCS